MAVTLTVVYFDQCLGAAPSQNFHFQRFLCKRAEKRFKKSNKFAAKINKNFFFKFAPKRWSIVLFPTLTGFLSLSEVKTFDQRFGAKLKKHFFNYFLQQICYLFTFFSFIALKR